MSLIVKTAPLKEPISMLEAHEHLRIDIDDDDGLIMGYIKAAREYCEGFQNRTFINTVYELWLDSFPCAEDERFYYRKEIELPRPPLVSVTSVEYYDTANVKYTMTASDYFAAVKSEPAVVSLAYGKTWPSITLRPKEAVCVTYTAGYGTAVAAVPQRVRQAMLLIIGHLYEHREAVTDKPLTDVPLAVESLLSLDRIWPI